jgi:hypothetical protein
VTVLLSVCVVPDDDVQVSTNAVFAVRFPEEIPALLVPVCHAAPAFVTAQLAAYVDDHEMVDAALYATLAGDVVSVATGRTRTVTDAFPDPPVPVHEIAKVVSAVSAPEVIPALLVPVCHAAPAFVTEQLVAFVDDHEMFVAVL